jgi:hypothetical protein
MRGVTGIGVVAVVAVLVACGSGGSSTTTIDSGAGDDGSGSSSGADDSGGRDATGSSSGSSSGSSGGDAVADGPVLDAGPCPDIVGSYGQISTEGQGCSDLNLVASECIMLAQQQCAFQLVSPTTGSIPAVNGTVVLTVAGSFTGAMLKFGTVQRSGCVGQWDAPTQTLTLDCGGMGTSQSCTVTLVRSSTTCT